MSKRKRKTMRKNWHSKHFFRAELVMFAKNLIRLIS